MRERGFGREARLANNDCWKVATQTKLHRYQRAQVLSLCESIAAEEDLIAE